MILGQLYYFEKKLESVRSLIETGNTDKIEIMGVEKDSLKDLKNISIRDLYNKLLAIFTQKYSQVLLEEGMTKALATWSLITNPYKSSIKVIEFDIFDKVSTWLNSNNKNGLAHLIEEIGISQENEEFAVIYGLKVINTLLGHDDMEALPRQSSLYNQKNINVDEEPKVIVVCSLPISPLFTNLNCIVIEEGAEKNLLISSVIDKVNKYPSISLILIEDSQWGDLNILIKKRLNIEILIAPLSLRQDTTGYFDNLVKKTLGVRLV